MIFAEKCMKFAGSSANDNVFGTSISNILAEKNLLKSSLVIHIIIESKIITIPFEIVFLVPLIVNKKIVEDKIDNIFLSLR